MKSIIERFNKHWYGDEKIKQAEFRKRFVFNKLVRYIDNRFIVGINWIRRLGKSTLLIQLIDYYLKKWVDAKNVMYYSFS